MTTVLVVDDDWTNRDLLEAVLSSSGYSVQQANSDAAAWAQLSRGDMPLPDVALIDVRLRVGRDGYALCRRIKANPRTAGLTVIMITAMDSPEDRDEAYASGADDFIARMDSIQLPQRIAALLRSS